jgi:hypothetical protein
VTTAAIGLVGIVLNQAFAVRGERHRERLESLVEVLAATAQVIGARERFVDLVSRGGPHPDSSGMRQALAEQSEVLTAWRTANARIELATGRGTPKSERTIANAMELAAWLDRFDHARASTSPAIQEYLLVGADFPLRSHVPTFEKAWTEMLTARRGIVSHAQRARSKDSMRPSRRRKRQRTDDWYAARPVHPYEDVEMKIAASFGREGEFS